MSEQPFLPYSKQTIEEDDIAAVAASLKDPLITRGPLTEQFEESVAAYCGAAFAVAFNSATTALAAACFAADVKTGDRLLTTPNSFVASTSCAYTRGAEPVFIDIDRNSGNFDVDLLEHNMNQSRTRGRDIVLPVHFAGAAVDMQRIERLVASTETVIIEDAAHALGARYADGEKVGSCPISQMTVFSFHPAKGITTGEGGIVTTNDEVLYKRLLLYRNNGIVRDPVDSQYPGFYEIHALTGNFHMTEMQAALGLSQMKKIDRFVQARRELVAYYREQLSKLPVRLFDADLDAKSAHHLFVVQLDFQALGTTRAELMQKLFALGIGTQVHYIPIYRHPYFVKRMGDLSSYFPEMEGYFSEALSLPLHPTMTRSDVERVVKGLFS